MRSKLIRARENLRRRRVNIEAAYDLDEADKEARKQDSTPPSYSDLIQAQKEALHAAHAALGRSRRVLIRELVQVFDVREAIPPKPSSRLSSLLSPSNAAFGVGSVLGTLSRRTGLLTTPALSQSYHPVAHAPPSPYLTPSSPSSAGTSISYAIASLALPANPAELASLPLEHVQAVIASFLQFLRLLTFYLGVKLPFEILWDGGIAYGVGRPWIHAIQGDEDGGWAKYPFPQPLFPPPPPSSSQGLIPDSPQADPYPIPPTISAVIGEPSPELLTSNTRLLPSFTTALAMLQYNVAYLLFTQRVPPPYALPLSSALPPDALRSLITLCFSPSEQVGLFSHGALRAPFRLSAPTSPHKGVTGRTRDPFELEFGDLLRVMHAAAGTNDGRAYLSRRKRGHGTGDDDWDIVEVEEEPERDVASRNRAVPAINPPRRNRNPR